MSYYQSYDQPKPLAQVILSWVAIVVTILVFADWSWVSQKWQKEKSFCSSQECLAAQEQMNSLLLEAQKKSEANTLTPLEAQRIQYRLVILKQNLPVILTGKSSDRVVIDLARECFVRNWKVAEEAPKYYKQLYSTDEAARRQEAGMRFNSSIIEAQDQVLKENGEQISLSSKDLLNFFLWLLKWYMLMTAPSIFILLLNKRFKGEKVREEFLLGWSRLILASLFGPIGILTISEKGAKNKRYYKLRSQYIKKRSGNFWLTSEEEAALWLQAEEPLVRFDQAMERVRQSGGRVTRPALICFTISLISLTPSIARLLVILKSNAAVVTTLVSVDKKDDDGNTKKGSVGSDHPVIEFEHSVQPDWRFVRVVFEERFWIPSELRWFKNASPRGPPAVEELKLLVKKPFLDCQKQKRSFS